MNLLIQFSLTFDRITWFIAVSNFSNLVSDLMIHLLYVVRIDKKYKKNKKYKKHSENADTLTSVTFDLEL